jgi:predicted nucleic acid-binding protein
LTVAYVDASALTTLALDEPASDAMRRWYVETTRALCSRIGIVETRRAVTRREHDPAHLETVLGSVEVIDFDTEIARHAGTIGPATLRTLDAIHLASAMALMGEIDAFVTYDDRQAEAARAVGLPVVRPGARATS